MENEQISVIGGGTMGRGIAYVAAVAGYTTVLNDVEQSCLDSARSWVEKILGKGVEKGKVEAAEAPEVLERLSFVDDLEAAVRNATVIIEAVPENFELKKELFAQADLFCGPDTLIASNTSSFSVSELAKSVERPDRFIGLHFFNPVHVMKLLEIVDGEETSDETIEDAEKLAEHLGKEAIIVRDTPGFATSRLGVALGLEAIRMLEEDVASAEAIDKAMELGYRHPMGPLRLTDLVGLDVRLGIADYLASELGERFAAPKLLRQMVEDGHLGQKSGRGFYDWS
ncbi:MAG: 3-hydroxyacyl-CoA dehydrogenase family protein [Thermoanaerobaculia bacterium]|nr:3-hydroxyacyl-CoA dehydrogenase family protein [Thermoanaerobaculia bacterium]